jgi:hypothetical protein
MTSGLKRHVRFFDANNDGLIDGKEVFEGLRKLRIGLFISWLGSLVLPALLSKSSGGSNGKISVDGIGGSRHQPDDSGGFGGGVSLTQDTYTLDDLRGLIKARGGKPRLVEFAIEWQLLFGVLRKFRPRMFNAQGKEVITRTEIQQLFDGSLFFQLTGEPVPAL